MPLPRRSFLTGLLALPAAALLPFIGKSKAPVIAVDLAGGPYQIGHTYFFNQRFYVVTGIHMIEWADINDPESWDLKHETA